MAITHLSDLRITDTCWDDLKAPATALYSPGNAGNGPDRDTTDGTLLFDASSTEVLFIHIQFPHAWKEGSTISPHLHWSKTTSAAGTVLWKMRYQWANIGDVFPTITALDTATEAVANADTADLHALAEFSDITDTDKTLSSMMLVELSRVGGTDTYGADAKFYEFDIHYQIDSLGSSEEYIKGS